jgi:hypothetical protein
MPTYRPFMQLRECAASLATLAHVVSLGVLRR